MVRKYSLLQCLQSVAAEGTMKLRERLLLLRTLFSTKKTKKLQTWIPIAVQGSEQNALAALIPTTEETSHSFGLSLWLRELPGRNSKTKPAGHVHTQHWKQYENQTLMTFNTITCEPGCRILCQMLAWFFFKSSEELNKETFYSPTQWSSIGKKNRAKNHTSFL